MNIRQAILRAADHIESYPAQFDFNQCAIPEDLSCGTPGCALGWIAFFSGAIDACGLLEVTERLSMAEPSIFYRRMNQLDSENTGNWMYSAKVCARNLRLYADKHHPQTVNNFARDLAARLAVSPRIAEDA